MNMCHQLVHVSIIGTRIYFGEKFLLTIYEYKIYEREYTYLSHFISNTHLYLNY